MNHMRTYMFASLKRATQSTVFWLGFLAEFVFLSCFCNFHYRRKYAIEFTVVLSFLFPYVFV